MRLSFVGEMGWELHVPRADCVRVYQAVMQAGARHGIANAGYRAIDSLSIEKGLGLSLSSCSASVLVTQANGVCPALGCSWCRAAETSPPVGSSRGCFAQGQVTQGVANRQGWCLGLPNCSPQAC